jgi:hypothetical protein
LLVLASRAEETDAVMPKRAIGAGHRRHCLGLVDRAEQRPPHRHIIKRRMQMIEAQDAHGRCILGNDSEIPVAGKLLQQIGGR